MSSKSRTLMPDHAAILDHWGEWLVQTGKVQDPDEVIMFDGDGVGPKLRCVCFACGSNERVQRAHIKAHAAGGTEDVSNIHILCGRCHWQSECLEGDAYFTWFAAVPFVEQFKQLMQRAMARMGCTSSYEFEKLALGMFEYCGGDYEQFRQLTYDYIFDSRAAAW